MKTSDPLGLWANMATASMIMIESQRIIAMRMWGMAGMWTVSPTENSRMISEKTDALARSAQAATLALMSGKNADAIAAAAMKPYRSRTRLNSRRLTRSGPKIWKV